MRKLLASLALLTLLAACATSEPQVVTTAVPFPEMTFDQTQAISSCRLGHPELDEWWVRFVKAWQKAAAAEGGDAP
jgi:ABC-type sugar transport system substrate-binding protein